MNIKAPVSTIMSTDLVTVTSEDRLLVAKETFDHYHIHHIPVVEAGKLVGILSKTDLLHFLDFIDKESHEPYLTALRLKNYRVKEIMIREPITVQADTPLQAVLEIFEENIFHALPVMEGQDIRGIVTTHDFIKALLQAKKQLT